MKKKSLKLRLPNFFRQRIHGKHSVDNMPELVKSESEGEKTESLIRDILRWADDGGKMLDLGSRTARSEPDVPRKQVNELRLFVGKEAQRDVSGTKDSKLHVA